MKTLSLKNIFSYFFVSVFVLTSFIFLPLFGNKISPAGAFTSNPEPTDVVKVGEIWNGNKFDEANLTTLLKYVSNNDSISTSDLSSLTGDGRITQTTGITAEDMRNSTAGGKSSGQDIIVRLGGLDWTPTYLSKTKSDELILTLWLANSDQLNGQTYDVENDKTFNDKGTSTFNVGGGQSNDIAAKYPENMYGTSYMNAVVLNNGGFYKSDYSLDEVTQIAKNPNHFFAQFTMESSPLYDYLITPSEVTWQEFGQHSDALGGGLSISNENWSTEIPSSGTSPLDPTNTTYNFSYDMNYASKQYSSQWSGSTLWLPSLIETGMADNETLNGIWATSTAQRSNIEMTWLRSGVYNDGKLVMITLLDGGVLMGTIQCQYDYSVRPALHLNLTKATLKETLATTVAKNPDEEGYDDISQEPGENANEVIFHIKTAAGFLKLSEATENGWAFDSNWTFLLDNDINLAAVCDNFTMIGAENNPFVGTFNGQGHTITYAQKGVEIGSLFGALDTCVIQNLNVNCDITATLACAGLAFGSLKDSTVHITHVNIGGKVILTEVKQDFAFAAGVLCYGGSSGNSGKLYLYDVNVCLDELGRWGTCLAIGIAPLDTRIDSCTFICKNVTCGFSYSTVAVGLVCYFGDPHSYGKGATFSASDVYVDMKCVSNQEMVVLCGSFADNTMFSRCYFNFDYVPGSKTNVDFMLFYAAATVPNIYDVALVVNNIKISSYADFINDQSVHDILAKNSHGFYVKYCESETDSSDFVYKYSIFDPDFTNGAWCQHDDLNGGLPMLRWTTWLSDYFNDFDMQAWAKEKMAL